MSIYPPIYEMKRIMEIKNSNLYPGEMFWEDASEIMEKHHAVYNQEVLEALREPDAFLTSPVFREYREFMEGRIRWRDSVRAAGETNQPAMRLWRQRQIKRCVLEIGEKQSQVITFPPLAFELAKGCSVNCWFCALNAGPLKEIFRYTPENALLWKGVLAAAREVIGPAARYAVSYWATEPLDNPDYEKFCRDMTEILGMYPQTTTAGALRDVERTKRLLTDSHEKGCVVNRFSVHDGELLLKIHREFTAKELADTELILENEESANVMVRSGRLFDMEHRQPERLQTENARVIRSILGNNEKAAEKFKEVTVNVSHMADAVKYQPADGRLQINIPGTTACLAGFLVKMPSKTIELISPCAADEENPMGYIIHDREQFETSEDFHALLNRMIERNMKCQISPKDRTALTKRFNYEALDSGFAMRSVFTGVVFEKEDMKDYIRHIGERLYEGSSRAWEIALECFYMFGKPEQLTYGVINDIYNSGMLEEKYLQSGDADE